MLLEIVLFTDPRKKLSLMTRCSSVQAIAEINFRDFSLMTTVLALLITSYRKINMLYSG